MSKFLEIREFHAVNINLVKFINISKSQKPESEDKYWVCFVFDNDLTCYVECDTEEDAKAKYNSYMDCIN